MKNIFCLSACFLLSLLIYSCGKDDTDFKSFLDNKEIVYPGRVSKVDYLAGNNRVALTWNPSPDPSVTKYVIYWNNKQDSIVASATSHKTSDVVKVIIPNLSEYTYSFSIYSFDDKGNKSVPLEVNNVKVFGSIYQTRLLNRAYNGANPYVLDENTGSVTLNFGTPDTINISTLVRYTNTAGATVEKQLAPQENSIVLSNYKAGTDIQYKSSYIPRKGAIDTFYVSNFDVFPRVYSYVMCDKSLFKSVSLPNDVYAEFGTSFNKLWDGSVGPQSYPNIFHSNEVSLPHHFTIDLGKVYTNLSRLEETGRDQSHNPINFEVWGISDITNAATTLPGSDGGWKNEMIAKGWTLLKDCARTDDGKAPVKFEFISDPPPVRYIRIRVKTNATNERYSNISELTFWNKQ